MKNYIVSILLLLIACGPSGSATWKVARDPTWFPNRFPGKEIEVTAFSDALLDLIGSEEDFRVEVYPASWSFLQGELLDGRVDGILTNLPPVGEYLELYDFSDLYLPTGPVLVVRDDSPIRGVEDLKGKEVGIVFGSSDILLLSSVPDLLITHYPSIPKALLGCWRGEVDAVLVPALIANAYMADFYEGKLKVVSPPLNDSGLRLAVQRGKSEHLLKGFNRGLQTAIKSGSYDRLREKWNLAIIESK